MNRFTKRKRHLIQTTANESFSDFVQEEDVLYRSSNLNFTNSGERHLAYERIAEKLRQHGASFEQTHRLNEKFLKLKWRYMKEHHLVEDGKRPPSWPFYQSLSFLLPSVLELERKRMNASVPENDNHHSRDEQYEVQACDVMPSRSNVQKARVSQKRKAICAYEETDNRLIEKRHVTNMAFAEFVACKLDEIPEPLRSHTERQIIEILQSTVVETYQEISHSAAMQSMHGEREIPIAAEIYHPPAPEPTFENCQPIQTRPRGGRNIRKPRNVVNE